MAVFVYARRDTRVWLPLRDLLMPNSRKWAQRASALVFFVAHVLMQSQSSAYLIPSPTHSYDTGTASSYFALQSQLVGCTHTTCTDLTMSVAPKCCAPRPIIMLRRHVQSGASGSLPLCQRRCKGAKLPADACLFPNYSTYRTRQAETVCWIDCFISHLSNKLTLGRSLAETKKPGEDLSGVQSIRFPSDGNRPPRSLAAFLSYYG